MAKRKLPVAKVGMRVDVFSADQRDYLGHGTITQVVSENYPAEIRLDSGGVTEGMRCWWHPCYSATVADKKEVKDANK